MLRLFVLLGFLAIGWSAGAEETAGSKAFAGWTGTCDNLGDCVAIGTSQRGDLFYVRIARAAGPMAEPTIKIILVPTAVLAAKGTPAAFRLKAVTKGKVTTLGPFPTGARDMNGAFFAEVPASGASRAFIDAIRNAEMLDYALLSARGTLDLDGLSATLRWIDDRQGRAGTATALVARGPASPSGVPARQTPPVVSAAKAGSVAAVAEPAVDAEVLNRAAALSDCEKGVVQAHEGYRAWRLGLDTILIEVPCLRGAYNTASALFFADAHGGAIRAAALPKAFADDAGTPANIVMNMAFDANTMALSEFGKGRGLGDCGATRTWLWTGETFALLRATRLDACPGAFIEDWPAVFTAQRADPPQAVPRR